MSLLNFRRGAAYFPVADVTKTGDYYRDRLGFLPEYVGGAPPQFAIYSRNGCALMFRLVSNADLIRPMEAQGGTWDAFFWVTAIESLFAEMVRAGADVVYPIVLQPYGMREFAVRDCDGHVLGFGEESSHVTTP